MNLYIEVFLRVITVKLIACVIQTVLEVGAFLWFRSFRNALTFDHVYRVQYSDEACAGYHRVTFTPVLFMRYFAFCVTEQSASFNSLKLFRCCNLSTPSSEMRLANRRFRLSRELIWEKWNMPSSVNFSHPTSVTCFRLCSLDSCLAPSSVKLEQSQQLNSRDSSRCKCWR